MKITGKHRRNLGLVELTLTLTEDEVTLLVRSKINELNDLTQTVARQYGLINHKNKPTDLLRDLASTLSFITPAEHDFKLGLRPVEEFNVKLVPASSSSSSSQEPTEEER